MREHPLTGDDLSNLLGIRSVLLERYSVRLEQHLELVMMVMAHAAVDMAYTIMMTIIGHHMHRVGILPISKYRVVPKLSTPVGGSLLKHTCR